MLRFRPTKGAFILATATLLSLGCKSSEPTPTRVPAERESPASVQLWTAIPAATDDQVLAGESALAGNGELVLTGHATGPFGPTVAGKIPEENELAFARDDTHHVALVARVAHTGAVRWIRAIPNPQRKIPPRLAHGPDGRIYVALNTRNYAPPMTFGDVPGRTADRPALRPVLHALTPEGETHWSKTLAPRADTVSQFDVRALEVAPNGDLILTATFSRTKRFLGQIDLTSHGGRDVLLARLASDGQIRWTRTFGGSGDEQLDDLVALPDGSVVAAGFVSSRFQSGTLQSNARRKSAFWAKFDATGKATTSRVYTDNRRASWVEKIAVDKHGRIGLIGTATSGPDLGDGPLLESNAKYRTFFALLDTNGSAVWAHGFEGDWNQAGAVAFGPSGELVVGLTMPGSQSGPEPKTIDIGGEKIDNQDGIDGLIFHMSARDGDVKRIVRLDSTGPIGGVHIAGLHRTRDDSMVAFGSYQGRVTFGDGPTVETPLFVDDPCASRGGGQSSVQFVQIPYDECAVSREAATAAYITRW